MTDKHRKDILKKLSVLGQMPDSKVKLAENAILIASLNQPGLSIDRFAVHLKKLEAAVSVTFKSKLAGGSEDNLETRRDVLAEVISQQFE